MTAIVTTPPPFTTRVLLVDDQAVIGRALESILNSQQDIQFLFCQNAQAAVATATTFGPTVILQDLVMPDMDGLTLVRAYRANPVTREVPLVVLSSREEPEIKAQAFALGANDYLVKLPATAELLARIRYHSQAYLNLLQKNRAQSELEAAVARISELNERLKFENQRMQTELDVAQQLQKLLLPLPAEWAEVAGLDVACRMETADEVGGDYYDIIALPAGHDAAKEIFIGIGDVTGHGLESGAIAMMMQMAIRSVLAAGVRDPVVLFQALNCALTANMRRINSSKNMRLSILHYCNGQITVSGQHETLLIARADGSIEIISTESLGFPVGLIEDISQYIHSAKLYLAAHDTLILYSDGITEMLDNQGNEFGMQRLINVVRAHHPLPAEPLVEKIFQAVSEHAQQTAIMDDCSLVVCKRRPK